MPARTPTISVLGLGDLLRRDDGFGPRVVHWIEQHLRLPPEIELVDAGTAGLHVLSWIAGRDCVILVDAIQAGAPPGTLLQYSAHELFSGRAPGPRMSAHQPGLRELFRLAELGGGAPRDVTMIGVQPLDLGDGLGLSPRIEAALEPVAGRVLAELERRGARAERILAKAVPAGAADVSRRALPVR